jgi:hypothetical protein
MKIPDCIKVTCCLLMILSVCLFSCEKPKKQGKVVVTEYDFYIERVTKTGFELCAKGKVKNVGEVDVKKVVVTGNCLSCTDIIQYDGRWIHSPDSGKTSEQQPVINYIPRGEEEEFIIKNIAYVGTASRQPPENIPEKLEVVVVSFETASE